MSRSRDGKNEEFSVSEETINVFCRKKGMQTETLLLRNNILIVDGWNGSENEV